MLGVASPNLRHSVRAIILTDDDRILLCRHRITGPPIGAEPPSRAGQRDGFVWAPPGGGIESDETLLAALRRELREEVGLALAAGPPLVWHQEVVAPGRVPGYDGIINDYFLVRTPEFAPRGTFSDDRLAAENIGEVRWWSLPDVVAYRGPDLFGPRNLGDLVLALIADGVPREPVILSR
jgi:8-oxo-dGTP diphosphatase